MHFALSYRLPETDAMDSTWLDQGSLLLRVCNCVCLQLCLSEVCDVVLTGVTRPAGAWLPEACWAPLHFQAAQLAEENIQNRPGSVLLPGGVTGTNGGVRTIEYSSLAELQKLSR